jgi:hypothetical protein
MGVNLWEGIYISVKLPGTELGMYPQPFTVLYMPIRNPNAVKNPNVPFKIERY